MAFHKKGQSGHYLNPNFVKLYHYFVFCVKFAPFPKSYDHIHQMTKKAYINKE